MIKNFLYGAVATLALSATAASAAVLSYTGTGETETLTFTNDFGLSGLTLDVINGADKSGSNGLAISGGNAIVTYEYIGFEAGLSNYSAVIGGTAFTNGLSSAGDTISVGGSNGLLDFAFGTARCCGTTPDDEFLNNGIATPNSTNFAIGYYVIDSTTALVLFDDRAAGDRDFDDIGMLVTIANVPLPAGGLLLLSGLAGTAAMRRRKKAA